MLSMKTLVLSAVCLSAGLADAAIIRFQAALDVDQEVPHDPVITAPVNPTGVAVLEYDTVTKTFDLFLSIQGISKTTAAAPFHALTNSHIHVGAPGVAGGVIIGLGNASAYSEPMTGFLSLNLNDVLFPHASVVSGATAANPSSKTSEAMLLANLTYINVHTNVNAPGEIRGQLIAVPEPAMLGLVGTGALLALRRRRA